MAGNQDENQNENENVNQDCQIQSHSFVQVDGKQCQTDASLNIPGELLDKLTNHKVELSFTDTEFNTTYTGEPVNVKFDTTTPIPVQASVKAIPDVGVKQVDAFNVNPVTLQMSSDSKMTFAFDNDTKGEFTTLKESLTSAINQLTIFKESFDFQSGEAANSTAVAVLALKNALYELNESSENIQSIANSIQLDTSRFNDVLTGVDRLLKSIDVMAQTTTQRLSDQFDGYNLNLSNVLSQSSTLISQSENILAKADNLLFAMQRMNQLLNETSEYHESYKNFYSDQQNKLINIVQNQMVIRDTYLGDFLKQLLKLLKYVLYAIFAYITIKLIFKVVGI